MTTVLRSSRRFVYLASFLVWGCSSSSTDGDSTALTAGGSGGAATGGTVGVGGTATGTGGTVAHAGTSGVATGGTIGVGGTITGGSGGTGGSTTLTAGGGSGGAAQGGGGAGGAVGGSGGAAGGNTGGTGGSSVPGTYTGTPFTTIQIPGTFFAADYDRGGPGVAYCHGNMADCAAGITTNDWYAGNTPGPYRAPMPANAPLCNGAACDDNVGLCRMNPAKPDKMTLTGMAMPPDVYVGYMGGGEWLKYTVQVMEAGMYSIGALMGAPNGANASWDFGGGIMTGTVPLPESPLGMCGCGESYHSWSQRDGLATVTFPSAGTYLMTFTVGSSLNIDTFTFTKM